MAIKDRTLIAAITIPCLSVLLYLGHDGAVIALLSTIIGWYFGREASEKSKEGKKGVD